MTSRKTITLRTALEADISEIIALYQGTVRSVNARDYSPEQVEVWASGGADRERWSVAIAEQYFVIAEIDGAMAGLGSIAADGYLDFLYVHKDHQRYGVGSALLVELERKAREQRNDTVYSHVSLTARGLFEKHGYTHEEDIEDMYRGVLFINALMVKKCRNF